MCGDLLQCLTSEWPTLGSATTRQQSLGQSLPSHQRDAPTYAHIYSYGSRAFSPVAGCLGERYNVLPTQAGFDPGKLLLSLSTPPAPLIGTKTCQPNAQTLLVPPSTAFHTLIVLTQDPLCWPERCCASCRLSTFSGEQQLRLAEYAEILPHSTSPGAQEL